MNLNESSFTVYYSNKSFEILFFFKQYAVIFDSKIS